MSELETNTVVIQLNTFLYWEETQEAQKLRTCLKSYCVLVVGQGLESRFPLPVQWEVQSDFIREKGKSQ